MPKAINRNKLVAFVLPISRKSCLHASGQNGMQQLFCLSEFQRAAPSEPRCRNGSVLLGSRGKAHWLG